MKVKKSVKIVIVIISILAIIQPVNAQQNWDSLPYKSYADYKMQNLNKSFVSTNILYDRVFPLSNVDEYTGLPAATNTDTTHPDRLIGIKKQILKSCCIVVQPSHKFIEFYFACR